MEEVRPIDDGVPYDSLDENCRHRLRYRIAHQPDGTPLEFPVNVIAGDCQGPVVLCVAGIHGDEPEGVAALTRLWEALDPARVDGTVVLVPVANPPAFRARARRNPDDGLDMNRAFPGDEDGTATEQLAHHLLEGVAREADLVVSMHSVGSDSTILPYVEYAVDSPVSTESRAAAEAFGAAYVDAFEWPAGLFSGVCSRAGIPAIEPEVGGLGATTPDGQSRYVCGVRNVLRHAGVLHEGSQADECHSPSEDGDGTSRIDRDGPIPIDREKCYATTGGVLCHDAELGEEVGADDRVAKITDFGGEPLEEIVATADGIVGEQRRTAAIHPGERVCTVFVPQS